MRNYGLRLKSGVCLQSNKPGLTLISPTIGKCTVFLITAVVESSVSPTSQQRFGILPSTLRGFYWQLISPMVKSTVWKYTGITANEMTFLWYQMDTESDYGSERSHDEALSQFNGCEELYCHLLDVGCYCAFSSQILKTLYSTIYKVINKTQSAWPMGEGAQ